MASQLSAELLGKFNTLDLIARYLVEGFITGLHRSPYHGFSVEFSQHRPYMPGDDTRHIDWKLFARTDRYHIKQFEEETNLRAYLLLDCSASMEFQTTGVSKFRYGSLLAASLAYLMIRQRDAAGLLLFDEKMRKQLPPRSVRSHLNQILQVLEIEEPAGKTATEQTLHEMAAALKRRGLVILISDLLDDVEGVMRGLKHFRHSGHEVIVFQVMDPAELDFRLMQGDRFRDLESGEQLSSDPRQVGLAVNKKVREFIAEIRNSCHREGIDHVLVDTGKDFERNLMEYLIKRKRLA